MLDWEVTRSFLSAQSKYYWSNSGCQ